MPVCTGPYLPEPGVYLQLSDTGATEWQSPTRNIYSRGCSGGIKTGDSGSLDIFLVSRYSGIGDYGHCWVGKDMGQPGWERLD